MLAPDRLVEAQGEQRSGHLDRVKRVGEAHAGRLWVSRGAPERRAEIEQIVAQELSASLFGISLERVAGADVEVAEPGREEPQAAQRLGARRHGPMRHVCATRRLGILRPEFPSDWPYDVISLNIRWLPWDRCWSSLTTLEARQKGL